METMFGATRDAAPVTRSVDLCTTSAVGTSAASPVPRCAEGLAAVFASLLLTPDDASGAAGPNVKSCARMLVLTVALLVTAAMLESY